MNAIITIDPVNVEELHNQLEEIETEILEQLIDPQKLEAELAEHADELAEFYNK